jgi:hypothetical protein
VSCAASISIAMARIARPVLLLPSHRCISAVMASATISVQSFVQATVTGPMEKFDPRYDVVMPLVSPWNTSNATLTIKSESPKVSKNVVSSGARTTKLITKR